MGRSTSMTAPVSAHPYKGLRVVRRSCSTTVTRLLLPNVPRVLPHLPIEIVDRIVMFAASSPHFSEIASLACASHQVRALTLRYHFSTANVSTRRHLRNLRKFQAAHAYVRELCSISVVLGESCPGHAAILPSLANLQRLTINFRRDGLSSQNDRLVAIFSPLHFTIPSLCSLTLTHLPRIDTFLLTCIAGAFPHLRSLELSVIDRLEHTCCWSCLIESSSGAFHSPLPHDYSTPEGLGHAFGTALAPLSALTRLALGVFLADEEALYEHAEAHSSVEVAVLTHVWYAAPLAVTALDACEPCRRELGTLVARREAAAAAVLRAYLPTLDVVEWGWET